MNKKLLWPLCIGMAYFFGEAQALTPTSSDEGLSKEPSLKESDCRGPLNPRLTYLESLKFSISRCFSFPLKAAEGAKCYLRVSQSQDGVVTKVEINECHGHPKLGDFAERAVLKASPLPKPTSESSFLPEFVVVLSPQSPRSFETVVNETSTIQPAANMADTNFGRLAKSTMISPKLWVLVYPEAARQNHDVHVLVAVEVLSSGKAGRVSIRQSSGFPILDKAAIEAVKGSEWVPPNEPTTASQIVVPLRFKFE